MITVYVSYALRNCGAGNYEGLNQITSRPDRTDLGQIGANYTSLVPDAMTGRASGLAEVQRSAAVRATALRKRLILVEQGGLIADRLAGSRQLPDGFGPLCDRKCGDHQLHLPVRENPALLHALDEIAEQFRRDFCDRRSCEAG